MTASNSVTICVEAAIPASDDVARILFEHLRDLALECEHAGWESTIVLTMTKGPTDE